MPVIDVTKNSTIMRWRREDEEKGRIEGKLEGTQGLLRKQLIRKFGPMPSWAKARIKKATVDELQQWAEEILVADTIEATLGKP